MRKWKWDDWFLLIVPLSLLAIGFLLVWAWRLAYGGVISGIGVGMFVGYALMRYFMLRWMKSIGIDVRGKRGQEEILVKK